MDINYHGKVVAFDLDDTLLQERDFCRSGFVFLCDPARYRVVKTSSYPDSQTLQKLTKEMDEALTRRESPFTPFENIFKPLALQAGEAWNLQDHITAYRNHRPDSLSFKPGILPVLKTLKDAGVRMALITDGRSITQRRKIETLGLEEFIPQELIFISEEQGATKESKQMFADVVRFFPEASGFFYVGDNLEKDFYHPNLLGWTTARVPYNSDNVHPDNEAPSPLHAPKIQLETIEQLINILHHGQTI